MSEEKVIEHTKKVFTVWRSDAPLWHKTKEFIGEIIVIIIAVSITLMFHNWNDERHERAIERDFLTGVSHDLKLGSAGLDRSVVQFQPTIEYYNTVWQQIQRKRIDARYVDTLSGYLRNTSYFVFDNSRFEGFKSSGYLRLIENKKLLQQLLALYTVDMPFERDADASFFHDRQQDFDKYIGINAAIDAGGNLIVSPLLSQRSVQYQIYNYLQVLTERKLHKQMLAKKMKALAAEIDEELQGS